MEQWLPTSENPRRKSTSAPSRAEDAATILVLDDRTEDRELLVYLLRHSRYRVLEAADGAEALRLAKAEHPDLVISDVLLPEMDGYEFVRQLREDPSLAGTTVIFYTAVFNEQEAQNLARDLGVSRILSKPTAPERLLEVVSEMLGTKAEHPPVPERFEDRHHQLLKDKLLEQVEARRLSEDRFRLLAENATDMIFRLRLQPTRVWEYVNPAATAILGYSPLEFYDDSELLFKIIHPDCRDELQRYIGEGPVSEKPIQLRLIHKNGSLVWAEISGTFRRDDVGNLVVLEGIARNITERKELLEEIRRSRDELEVRIRERTAELERANQELNANSLRLEIMNRELQEFAFVASHDLQEPLRKIQSFSDRLHVTCANLLPEEGLDYLQRMRNAASRMQTLLQDLLKYSQITTKRDPFISTPLTKPIREVISDLSVLIDITGGIVEVSDLPAVEADETQMRQLFQNLIGNSLKYHGPEKPIVKVYNSGCNNGWCEILVEDNGIGFDEKYLDKIFMPFQRLHGRSSPYEGTGMGLAICRKIVERHKGTLTAKSTPGKGSTFIIRLPERQSPE